MYIDSQYILSCVNIIMLLYDCTILEPLEMPMDLGEFRSDRYQRVYQYLQLYSGNKRGNIDRFCYNHQVEGDDKDCLQLLLRSFEHNVIKFTTLNRIVGINYPGAYTGFFKRAFHTYRKCILRKHHSLQYSYCTCSFLPWASKSALLP